MWLGVGDIIDLGVDETASAGFGLTDVLTAASALAPIGVQAFNAYTAQDAAANQAAALQQQIAIAQQQQGLQAAALAYQAQQQSYAAAHPPTAPSFLSTVATPSIALPALGIGALLYFALRKRRG